MSLNNEGWKLKCPYCKKDFVTNRIDKRFCSLSCSTKYASLKSNHRKELWKLSEHDLKIHYEIHGSKQ